MSARAERVSARGGCVSAPPRRGRVSARAGQAPLLVALAAAALAGCAGADAPPPADGTYTGHSGPDEQGAVGEVTLTVSGGAITEATFVTRQADGTVKDESYGTTNGEVTNEEFYAAAQAAVAAGTEYARRLVEVGDVGDVDVIAGATLSHGQFVEAVEDALAQARG